MIPIAIAKWGLTFLPSTEQAVALYATYLAAEAGATYGTLRFPANGRHPAGRVS